MAKTAAGTRILSKSGTEKIDLHTIRLEERAWSKC